MENKYDGLKIKIVKEVIPTSDQVDQRLITADRKNLSSSLEVLLGRMAKSGIPDHQCIIKVL